MFTVWIDDHFTGEDTYKEFNTLEAAERYIQQHYEDQPMVSVSLVEKTSVAIDLEHTIPAEVLAMEIPF